MDDLDHAAFGSRLAAARGGDRAAWEQLYESHAPAVLGYLRTQGVEAAEDVLAEVWLHVVRDLERFDGDSGGFRAWILRIAHNRLLDARRASSRRPEVSVAEVPDASGGTEDPPELDLEQVDLDTLFVGLPDGQRAVLYLRYVLDLSHGEIASILGSTPAAVKMQQRRALDTVAQRRSLGDRR